MKIFFDTEFIEGAKQPTWLGLKVGRPIPTIDLLSIGLFREDGRQVELLNAEADLAFAWHARQADGTCWVRQNVLGKIYKQYVHGDMRNHRRFSLATMRWLFAKYGWSRENIAAKVAQFAGLYRNIGTGGLPLSWCNYLPGHDWHNPDPEFVAYYADYDWVVLCWLFGTMSQLPKGMPQFCLDLKQSLTELQISKEQKRLICPDWPSEHCALDDAKWNYQLYRAIGYYVSCLPFLSQEQALLETAKTVPTQLAELEGRHGPWLLRFATTNQA